MERSGSLVSTEAEGGTEEEAADTSTMVLAVEGEEELKSSSPGILVSRPNKYAMENGMVKGSSPEAEEKAMRRKRRRWVMGHHVLSSQALLNENAKQQEVEKRTTRETPTAARAFAHIHLPAVR